MIAFNFNRFQFESLLFICFKNASGKNIDFRKNTAECRIELTKRKFKYPIHYLFYMAKEEINQDGIYRKYDSSAIQLIAAWPKVLQVLRREIPDPEIVEIFPTNYCNFACPHCRFQDLHGDKTQYLNIDRLEILLNELSQRNIHAIELSGGGEPLEHPQIGDLLDKLAERNIRVGLITNGYKFIGSDELKEKALQSCNWIRFSVDGFTDETYQRVHGRKDISYSKLRGIISEFVGADRDVLKIEMKMLISKLNVHEIRLAIEEALALGVDCFQYKFLSYPKELSLEEKEIHRAENETRELIDKSRDTPVRAELVPPYMGPKTYEKCLMTFLHPVIDWDGEIYLCAFFEHRKKEHSLGNIREGGFFRYWDSPHHLEVFDTIDPATCVPKCPMLRYNPVIDFIKTDHYRFSFI